MTERDLLDMGRIDRLIRLRLALCNLVGVFPLVALGGTFLRYYRPPPTPIPMFWVGVISTLALYVPMWVTSGLGLRLLLARATRWIGESREVSPRERQMTTLLPLAISALPGPWWLLATPAAVLVVKAFHAAPPSPGILVGCVGIVLSGMVSCTLTYLAAEDALRPLFARVLGGTASWSGQGRGLRGRFIAYWLVGSTAGLVCVGLVIQAFPLKAIRPIALTLCVVVAIIGFVVANLAALSITRPLNKVREGMRRIADGDLSASVDVDDLGDIGFLQSVFNRMVAGLRERDQLRDAFGRHVGPEVARRALQPGSLVGNEVEATVLFVDVVGSTSLAAEREPKKVVAMLNALFGAVVRTVGAEGGFVNQFQGDGALCFFGMPEECPDHAERGCRAAVALRSEIILLGEIFPGLDAAIGVSSGRVVAGHVGTEDRHDYTAIGDPVNEASRLCDAAKSRPSRVLVSEATLGGRTRGWLTCGSVELRGRPRPSVAYEPMT